MGFPKGFNPAQLKQVLEAGKETSQRREVTVRIAVELCPGAPRTLAMGLKEALVPTTSHGLVHVGSAPAEGPVTVNPETDACVVVLGSDRDRSWAVAAGWASQGIPTCLVAESALELPDGVDFATIAASNGTILQERVAQWLVQTVDDPLALALNFPFCRKACASDVVARCAAENGAVGFVELIPGADLPVMAVNECRMVLQMAAVYGYPVGPARLPEVAAVLLGGLGMRTIAQRLSAIAPHLSWLAKGVVAYGGTYALGALIRGRFEAGESFDRKVADLGAKVRTLIASVTDGVAERVGDAVVVEPGAVYIAPDQVLRLDGATEFSDASEKGPKHDFIIRDGRAVAAGGAHEA